MWYAIARMKGCGLKLLGLNTLVFMLFFTGPSSVFAGAAIYPSSAVAHEACLKEYTPLPKASWSSNTVNCAHGLSNSEINDSEYSMAYFGVSNTIYVGEEGLVAWPTTCDNMESHFMGARTFLSCELKRFYIAPDGECPLGYSIDEGGLCHAPTDFGESDSPQNCSDLDKTTGNPINFTNGNKYQKELDVGLSNSFTSLILARHYNSQDASVSLFGRAWSSDLVSNIGTLDLYGSPNATEAAAPIRSLRVVTTSSGRRYEFEKLNDEWITFSNVTGTLVEDDNNFIFEDDSRQRYTFNASGQILSISNAQSLTTTYGYNTEGNVDSITDDFGNQITLTYQNNFIHTATVPDYGTFTYGYTGDLLTSVSFLSVEPDAIATTKTYIYDDPNFVYLLTGIIDENGERYATWTYDEQGRGITSEHGDNGAEKVTIRYDSDTQSTVINAMGKEKIYTFTDINGVKQITHIEDKQSENCPLANQGFTYDAQGFLETKINGKDVVSQYTRNSRGLVTRKRTGLLWGDANGDGVITTDELTDSATTQTITTQWHDEVNQPKDKKVSGLDTNGIWQDYSSTQVQVDGYGRVISHELTDLTPYTTAGRTRSTTYSYQYFSDTRRVESLSINGPRLASEVEGGIDDITTQYFNEQGQLVQLQNALGHSTFYSNHNALGQAQTIEGPNNSVTNIAYGTQGRVNSVAVNADQGASVTHYDYYPNGLLQRITLADQTSLSFDYNAARQLTRIQNHLNERIEFIPQILHGGWEARTVLTSGGDIWQTSQRVYDELGRVMGLLGSNGQHTQLRYDANDQLEEVDELGHGQFGTLETRHLYDTLGRLEQTRDANEGLTQFSYDGQNQLVAVSDARQNTTQYIVDGFGDTIQEISPDRGVITYWFDSAGNNIRREVANQAAFTMTYDALNRPVSSTNDSGDSIYRQYDLTDAEHKNSMGRLSSIVEVTDEKTIQTDYSYTQKGQVSHQQQLINPQGQSSLSDKVQYQYNLMGDITQITYPSGRVVNYEYNQGQLLAVTTQVSPGAEDQIIISAVDYGPFGLVKGYTYGNGFTLNTDFDLDGRLKALTLQNSGDSIINLDYSYDPFNNIESIDNNNETEKSQSFNYDWLHRLVNAQGIYGQLAFQYDAVGNRLERTQTLDGQTVLQNNEYDVESNQLQQSTVLTDGEVSQNTSFIYDDTGNITQRIVNDDIVEYNYNAANRMAGVNINTAEVAEYSYNSLGQKVQAIYPGYSEQYVYNQSGQLLAVLDATGSTKREYIYLGSQKLALVVAGETVGIDLINNIPFGIQDKAGTVSLSDDNTSITLQGNRWRATSQTFDVDSNTYIEFDFESDLSGEVHGIALDEDLAGSGNRTFFLGGSQHWGFDDFVYTGGIQHFSIPVGQYSTGNSRRIVFVNDHDVSGADSYSTFSNVQLCDGPCSEGRFIDSNEEEEPLEQEPINLTITEAFGDQNGQGVSVTENEGIMITLTGNSWRKTPEAFDITSDTVLEFEFESDGRGEVQGIALDEDDIGSGNRVFRLVGSQIWGFDDFIYTGGVQQFSIPVGQYYTGAAKHLVFINDHDVTGADSYSIFRNVRLCEGPCPEGSGAGSESSEPQVIYIHNDHLGTPQLMSNQDQSIVWAPDYTPFGELVNGDGEVEASRFPGQYFDVATGFYYNYFRDYDPSLGRYIQSDPIGLAGGINTYAYVNGNPVNYIDPLGLYGCRYVDWGNGITAQVCDSDGGDPYGGGCRTAECAAGLPPNPPPASSEQKCELKCNFWVGLICGPVAALTSETGPGAAAAYVACRAAVYVPCAKACEDDNECKLEE